MTKLHEILAVEQDLLTVEKNLRKESIATMGKESLFMGMTRTLTMFDEEAAAAQNHTEVQELTTTTAENLEYYQYAAIQAFDITLKKDTANCSAVGDVVVDGETILYDVPAMTLLGLEAKLAAVRDMYKQIKTLAPGIKWIPDLQNEKNEVYITSDTETTFKTEKIVKPVVMAEATKEHPAQVQATTVQINVGKYEITKYSGMMAPITKANLIARIDKLIRAVKQARMRANQQEVPTVDCGAAIFRYING